MCSGGQRCWAPPTLGRPPASTNPLTLPARTVAADEGAAGEGARQASAALARPAASTLAPAAAFPAAAAAVPKPATPADTPKPAAAVAPKAGQGKQAAPVAAGGKGGGDAKFRQSRDILVDIFVHKKVRCGRDSGCCDGRGLQAGDLFS